MMGTIVIEIEMDDRVIYEIAKTLKEGLKKFNPTVMIFKEAPCYADEPIAEV